MRDEKRERIMPSDPQAPVSAGRLSPELHAHHGPVEQAGLGGVVRAAAQQEGARAGRRGHLHGEVATANTTEAHRYLWRPREGGGGFQHQSSRRDSRFIMNTRETFTKNF